MDKTYRTEFRRRYLIEGLPEPLSRASKHLQIFDNYLTGTRMRIRSVRDPETKLWTWTLQQRLPTETEGPIVLKIGEIHLNEAEHSVLEPFEGNEIRKNRYFHEFDGLSFAFDMYLWPLWGLNVASVEFGDEAAFREYLAPPFAVFDVSGERFFLGENLFEKKFEDVRGKVSRI
jgi:CYTH domain-containing protein